MSEFGDWLKRWSARVLLGKDGTGLRLSGQQLNDLADLIAQQHEFISTHWEIKHKRCEHGSCKSLRMAEAFKERYLVEGAAASINQED